jgi:hypothetical protein
MDNLLRFIYMSFNQFSSMTGYSHPNLWKYPLLVLKIFERIRFPAKLDFILFGVRIRKLLCSMMDNSTVVTNYSTAGNITGIYYTW